MTLEQLRMAIDGARALVALIEDQLGPDGAQLKDALSQLQMAYVQMTGQSGDPQAPRQAQLPAQMRARASPTRRRPRAGCGSRASSPESCRQILPVPPRRKVWSI